MLKAFRVNTIIKIYIISVTAKFEIAFVRLPKNFRFKIPS